MQEFKGLWKELGISVMFFLCVSARACVCFRVSLPSFSNPSLPPSSSLSSHSQPRPHPPPPPPPPPPPLSLSFFLFDFACLFVCPVFDSLRFTPVPTHMTRLYANLVPRQHVAAGGDPPVATAGQPARIASKFLGLTRIL